MAQRQFSLQVLGVGAGASFVYEGLISSSFMLLHDGEPFCLVDLGLGVGREVVRHFGDFPETIVITHNHSDHAGELPVVLRVELAKGRKKRVVSHETVSERLQRYRIAEHHQQMSPSELADWVSAQEGEQVPIGYGLRIQFFPGVHSEASYGFLITDEKGELRLGYTGDSRLDASLFSTLDQAKVFIMDARPKPNPWHAHFEEMMPWLHKPNRYILGHGLSAEQVQEAYADLPLLLPNQEVCF